MSDPMATPPVDHGSDRYGYVEYAAPEGVGPPPADMVDMAMLGACQDCNPNLFFRWTREGVWKLTVAHDDTCPNLARIERENGTRGDGA